MTTVADVEGLHETLDQRTLELLRRHGSVDAHKGRGWLVRRALVAADVVGLAVAFGVSAQLYPDHSQVVGAFGQFGELLVFLACLPAWVVAAKLYGLYDRDEERAAHSAADETTGVFHLVTVGTWLLLVGAYLTRLIDPSVPKLLVFWMLAIVAIPAARSGARAYCRRRPNYLQNTIIVGAGDVGQLIARKLAKHPEYGINLVGFVDAHPKTRGEDLEGVTLLGDLVDVPALVEFLDVERVIIAFSNDRRENIVELIRDINKLGVQIDVVPRFFDILSTSVDVNMVEGLPLIGLRSPQLSRSSRFLKRSFDLIVASVGLIVLAPFLAIVALAIKLDSRGPVIFRQARMGSGGRAFSILKFRTMSPDAEDTKAMLAHLNKHARKGGDPRMFKIDDDPRVTRVGGWLRRFSIDELPQLWNVVRGEMSLVGPRPLILEEHAHVTDWAERRLDLKPGITGLWQVLGGDSITFEEMVKLDYRYVTSWSLPGDLRLLIRTLPVVFAKRETH